MTVASEENYPRESIGSKIAEGFKSFFGNRMVIYVIRRLLTIIPLFFGISMLTFGMIRMLGDPTDSTFGVSGSGEGIAKIKETLTVQYGLDKPLHIQYLLWLKGFVTWEFGYSIVFSTSNPAPLINELIKQTLKLQYIALFFSVAISIPLGIYAATNHQTSKDSSISTFALLGNSIPVFVLGIALIIFIRQFDGLNWMPIKNAYTPYRDEASLWDFIFRPNQHVDGNVEANKVVYWDNFGDNLLHLLLPVFTLTIISLATITRLVRSNMLEILRQDFILAARANGLPERVIIWKHALRNAIIPVITLVALSFGFSIGGAPITETVFSWPGLGRVYIIALFTLDMVLVLSIAMIITLAILLSNLVADIVYVFVDPRIRL